jgi:hypothetical protein
MNVRQVAIDLIAPRVLQPHLIMRVTPSNRGMYYIACTWLEPLDSRR